MILGQIIVPVYLPMPDCGDVPAEEVNIVLFVAIVAVSVLIGFAIGLLICKKYIK